MRDWRPDRILDDSATTTLTVTNSTTLLRKVAVSYSVGSNNTEFANTTLNS